ncbi:MAG TPA: DMT family transporter [Nostocaceae cyanobacterium]|nr:DMT family transporter [Nostocaceae cyanobacterium]
MAISLLCVTIIITGDLALNLTPLPILLLLLSGAVGIGLGDTAFLAAINHLGARRALLLGTLSPPMTAIAATIFLKESLNISAWCGILLTILGVAWVITERVSDNANISSTHLWRGIGFGFLAEIADSSGAIFSRAAFGLTNFSPLWAALLRLVAALVIILACAWFPKRQKNPFSYPYWQSKKVILASFSAAFCGTYLGIWLQQIAIKFTSAGIATTLLQTSPLFVIPIAIFMGEKVTWRAIAGVIIAILGIALLFYLK